MIIQRRGFIGALTSAIVGLSTHRILGLASPVEAMPKDPFAGWQRTLLEGRIGLFSAPTVPEVSSLLIRYFEGEPLKESAEIENMLHPVANTEHPIPIGLMSKAGDMRFVTPKYKWTFHRSLDDPVYGLYLANTKGNILYYEPFSYGPFCIQNNGDEIAVTLTGGFL